MRNVVIILVWLVLWVPWGVLLACAGQPPRPDAPEESRVRVDFGRSLGPVPTVLRPGFWVAVDDKIGPYPLKIRIVTRDIRLGVIEIDIERAVLSSSGLEDVGRQLAEDAEFTAWAQAARQTRARLLVTLVKMPGWLAKNPSDSPDAFSEFPAYSISPPRDYAVWERLVEAVATHFKQLGVHPAYVIWNEPDIYSWGGTDREYLELYGRAAQAIRRADPEALVGGPSASELLGSKKPPDKATRSGPFLQQFLLGAGQSRLPLDFVVWAEFNALPSSYTWKAETVRAWLQAAGYPASTPLWLLKWNGWQHFDTDNPIYRFGSADRDTEVNAAYAIATVAGMHAAGISLQTFGTLEELDQGMFKSPSQFVGGFGALTRSYIVKPSYHAFQMLGALDGNLVAAETADPLLTVLAASGKDSRTVLLSNFIPTPQMLKEDRDRILQLPEMQGSFFRQHGVSRELALGVMAGTIPLDDGRVPAAARPRLERLREMLAPEMRLTRANPARRTTPVQVVVRLDGLGPGSWRLERYLIDAQHSNSFARRKEVEERIARLRSDVRVEVAQRLRQEGATEGQVRALERMADTPPTRRGPPPEDLRPWRDRALQLVREVPVQLLDRLNRSPGIGLDRVESAMLATGSPEVSIEMTPNSVTLLTIRRDR